MELNPNWNNTAADYAKHRAGFPDWFFDRLQALGMGRPGEKVLDLGTGTGALARGFALRGCKVTGIDLASEMMAAARELDRAAGVEIDYRTARAEATGGKNAGYDLVSAGTCWFWFDGLAAGREAMRVLKPGGHLLICCLAWLPLPCNVVRRTEELIERHNPDWKLGNDQPNASGYLNDLALAGFGARASFSVDYDILYSHATWRGRIRASAGIGASLSTNQIAAFDDEHATMLASHFPTDQLPVPHRLIAAWGTKPA